MYRLKPASVLRIARWQCKQFASGDLHKFKIPFLGDSVTQGVVKYKVKPGDFVEEDGVVAEVESDKTTQPIRSNVAGVVKTLLVAEDSMQKINTEIVEIEEKAAPEGGAAAAPKEEAPKEEKPKAAPQQQPQAPKAAPAAPAKPAAPKAAPKPLDPKSIQPPQTRRVKMTPMRMAISKAMMSAKNETASLTTFNKINMDKLMKLRTDNQDAFVKKFGVKLGLMSPFVKACAQALTEYPQVNASIEGDEIVYNSAANIGVAVATPRGLVVPILRDCEHKTLSDIEKDIAHFAQKGKDGQITLPEMKGGTFTISNGGVFGSLFGTPILNYPQSAILGMHAIVKEPWVNENDEVVVANVMYVALTYDHRLLDGKDAVTFLVRLKYLLEDPARFILA